MTSHDPIIPGARALFDRASSRLDADAATRLRRARRDALDGAPVRARSFMVPAGAFAATVLALGLAWWVPQGPTAVPADGLDDFAASSEIDALMVDEDAEVYAWLADAPVATGPGARR